MSGGREKNGSAGEKVVHYVRKVPIGVSQPIMIEGSHVYNTV